MNVRCATFDITWNDKRYAVCFCGSMVAVADGDHKTVEYENEKAKWKPCATHAMELVRLAFGGEHKTNFAKRRTALAKPVLKVVTP